MIKSFKHSLFLFNMFASLILMASLYYFVVVMAYNNYVMIGFGVFLFSIFISITLSKLAVEPLENYINEIEHYTKETLHELNIPVSTIIANSKMLEKKCSDEKSLKRLKRINSACATLSERYRKLEYILQHEKEQKEVFDLQILLENRLEEFSLIYPNRKFIVELSALKLECDRVTFLQIIDNIVENSVKYSSIGSTIHIKLNGTLFMIEDEGKGMDEIALLKIFDRYYQENSQVDGFGIGLALVKSFCDKNRVKLGVESRVGVGTKVIMDLQEIEAVTSN